MKRGDDVFRTERRAVGEFYAGAEFKLPGFQGGIVRPVDGEGGLEVAEIVNTEEAVVEEYSESCVFGGGDGAGFPVAGVERGFRELEFEAEGATVGWVLGGGEMSGVQEGEGYEEKYLEA